MDPKNKLISSDLWPTIILIRKHKNCCRQCIRQTLKFNGEKRPVTSFCLRLRLRGLVPQEKVFIMLLPVLDYLWTTFHKNPFGSFYNHIVFQCFEYLPLLSQPRNII